MSHVLHFWQPSGNNVTSTELLQNGSLYYGSGCNTGPVNYQHNTGPCTDFGSSSLDQLASSELLVSPSVRYVVERDVKEKTGIHVRITMYTDGSFQKSRAPTLTPNNGALIIMTPTQRTPNLWKHPLVYLCLCIQIFRNLD